MKRCIEDLQEVMEKVQIENVKMKEFMEASEDFQEEMTKAVKGLQKQQAQVTEVIQGLEEKIQEAVMIVIRKVARGETVASENRQEVEKDEVMEDVGTGAKWWGGGGENGKTRGRG